MSGSMTKTEIAAYVEGLLELMEDTDWSSFPKLRDTTSGDLVAAAVGLYDRYGMRRPNSEDMLRMLFERYGYFMDDNALACAEQQDFMDQADTLGLPSALIDSIAEGVVHTMKQRWTERGWTFVDLSASSMRRFGIPADSTQEGYYVFRQL